MKLSTWIKREGRGAKSRLARSTGLAYSTINYLAADKGPNGKPSDRAWTPRVDTAKRIEEATGGAVKAVELMGLAKTG